MADKTIGSLPQAQSVDDSSLFVCEQQGVAMKATGAQWKGYAIQAVSQYVAPAQQAAQQAQQAAQQATQAVSQIGTAVEDTQANAQAAQEAKEAAEAAQGLAETAKTEAEAAASGVAEDAQAAEQAKEAAIAAQQAAETAGGNAETSATGAATSASQASQSASDASGSATAAAGSATTASQAASNAQSAQTLAETAKAGAEAARDAIVNMLVEAITLETGQPATVSKSLVDQVYKLTFGLPKGKTGATGATGPQGVSVESIQLTNGNHAPGTTDTYTITLSDGSAFQFTVYNGANGTGAGDMMADGSVPMTGPLNMGGNKITNLGAPGADTDAVRKSDLDAVAAEVDGILDGTTPAHLAPATDTKIGGVIIGDGLSVEADGTLSADDQLPAGGTQGQVLTQGTTGPEWQDAPSGLPDGGTPGQLLSKTESGAEWVDKPVMYVTVSGTTSDKSSTEIIQASINGYAVFAVVSRLGALYALPLATQNLSGQAVSFMIFIGDRIISCYIKGTTATVSEIVLDASRVTFAPGETGLTADNVQDAIEEVQGNIPTDYVPTSRTVNGQALSQNITLDAEDVGAVPTSRTVNGKALSRNISLTASDVGARANTWTPTASEVGAVPTSRTVNGKALSSNITLDADDVGALDQTSADARYLQLSGGTMRGALALPGNPTSDNQAANKAYVDALKPNRQTATLSASGWTGNAQTITVQGVIADQSAQDIDISCTDRASADAWAAGGVWCNDPTQANRLTFTCTTAPTANINLNIRLWEGG